MKRYNCKLKENIENPKIDNFLLDIIWCCNKHGLSIGHEDNQGAFLITDFNEETNRWLLEATDKTE